MNTIEISSDETLNHALIQCLRLFAQHGRKIRNQELPADAHTSDDEMLTKASKGANDKEDSQR